MTGLQLQRLMRRTGLSDPAFGRALGYIGKPDNIARSVRRLIAHGKRELRPDIAARADRIKQIARRMEDDDA